MGVFSFLSYCIPLCFFISPFIPCFIYRFFHYFISLVQIEIFIYFLTFITYSELFNITSSIPYFKTMHHTEPLKYFELSPVDTTHIYRVLSNYWPVMDRDR